MLAIDQRGSQRATCATADFAEIRRIGRMQDDFALRGPSGRGMGFFAKPLFGQLAA